MPNEESKSFWTTIPGILTGVAALLTAVTGLWIAMAPHDKQAAADHAPASVSAPPIQNAAPGSASPGSTQQSGQAIAPSAATSDVVLTSRAGEVTRLSPKTFDHNYDKAIELTSGQTIAFEKIKAIDFLTVHDEQREVDVKVTLADGRSVNGALRKDYAFTGENDLGSFSIVVQNVKQITFP